MRAIRAQDGCVYHLSRADLPNPPTLEALHNVLSEHAGIPLSALIVMHPSGRQADRDSVTTLLRDESDDSDDGLVYLFDREVLVVDLESEDGKLLLDALDLDSNHLLEDVGQDPDKQYEAAIDLIQCVRHQHRALIAALSNLERHRGGRQEAIAAYKHFASPLLTKYSNLLAIYPACMSLVGKVRVTSKMQASSPNTPPKDRLLSDFVSREKMENVRDGCKRTLDEIQKKNRDLEEFLQGVANGTEKLKLEINEAYNVEDLVDCEHDAAEAHSRLKELLSRPGQRNDEEDDELDSLYDECMGRLRFLVDRRNAETRQLLQSLQEIAKFQSVIATAPEMINSLNQDLKTKCDSFKHLTRLQLLVPAYAATLAESIRRRSFTKYLTSSSSAYAELFSKFSSDERRRRGIYQVEWAGKLPWELPGLEEGLAFIEVELRSSNASLASAKLAEGQVGMEDLEALEQILLDIQEGLSPEDMPGNGLQHPVQDTTALIRKLKKNIETLTADFERLNRKLQVSDDSPTTSMSTASSANEAMQALEEKRVQLERELQSERSARESEVAALQVRNSELERLLSEQAETRSAMVDHHRREKEELSEDHMKKAAAAKAEIETLVERTAHLAGESTAKQAEVNRLRQQVQEMQEDCGDLQARLEEQETRVDHLEKRKSDLLQAVNEKDRQLRDHRTESELDRATLEKELAEAKEKIDILERETAQQVSSLAQDLEKMTEKASHQESELAELQTMCDERGRSISAMRADSQATAVKIKTLLSLCSIFYASCEDFLQHFVREDVPKAPSSAAGPVGNRARGPAASFKTDSGVSFDETSLDSAIDYMQSHRSQDLFDITKAQCDYCLHETKKWQKECKKYKERTDRVVLAARDKLAFRSFHVNDLALFLPTKNTSKRMFAAFNFGRPNYFLRPTGRLVEDVQDKEWIVARITSISDEVITASEGNGDSPYALPLGSKYFMLEAEFWPTRAARRTSRTISSDKKDESPITAEPTSSPIAAAPIGTSPEALPPSESGEGPFSPPQALPQMEAPEKEEEATQLSPDTHIGKDGITSDTAVMQEGEPPATMEFSAFTVVRTEEPAPSSTLRPSVPSGASSLLSSSRPKDLSVITEVSPAGTPEPTAIAPVLPEDHADEEAAFLPPISSPTKLGTGLTVAPQIIPRSTSGSNKQYPGGAFSRSFGSSNGSGGSSGFRNRLSSSSFLTPSKAPATVAASPGAPSSFSPERTSSFSTPKRQDSASSKSGKHSQTIGRYTAKSARQQVSDGHMRQSSASATSSLSQSSARDLLRSFTTGS